nr:glycosyltransferase [uncultured Flavobacterium sp.]
MKIAVFTCSVARSAGGLLDAIRDLYKCVLVRENNEIEIFSYIEEDTKEELPNWSGFDLKLYPKSNFFFYSSEAKKGLLESDADILHVHGLWRYPHAFISKWKSRSDKPVVVTPHGMLDPYIIANQGKVKRILGDFLFARNSFEKIDCYHALCKAELDAIRAYGIDKPVAIIPNGINMPESDLVRKQPDDNKKHLLFLARLHPKKGVDMLLEAIGQVKTENPEKLKDYIVDIVGWPQENFDVKLKEIVAKYALEDIVIFHGGLFGEKKSDVYAKAYAYILPSHGEGLPMTVLEAWSWGLPVIMTPQCNIPEGFDNDAAIAIQNNTESVKEGLLKFMSLTEEEALAMGQRGKELVKKEFTWQLSAEKMDKVYGWLAGKLPKPEFIYE